MSLKPCNHLAHPIKNNNVELRSGRVKGASTALPLVHFSAQPEPFSSRKQGDITHAAYPTKVAYVELRSGRVSDPTPRLSTRSGTRLRDPESTSRPHSANPEPAARAPRLRWANQTPAHRARRLRWIERRASGGRAGPALTASFLFSFQLNHVNCQPFYPTGSIPKERGGYILLKFGVFKLELADGCIPNLTPREAAGPTLSCPPALVSACLQLITNRFAPTTTASHLAPAPLALIPT